MNFVIDKETKIPGIGLTQADAYKSMRFYVERSGKLSTERLERRKQMYTWLPRKNLLHVNGVCAILYEGGYFKNTVTGKKVKVVKKAMSQYLYLFSAFDGMISFEDFTITIAKEVNRFLDNISNVFQHVNDFPYIRPVEDMKIKNYHEIPGVGLSFFETKNDTIVLYDNEESAEVDRVPGVDTECLIAYLLAYKGYAYDGKELIKVHED